MTQSDTNPSVPNSKVFHHSVRPEHTDIATWMRERIANFLRMRQGRLANGLLVNYRYTHHLGMPHFEFYSPYLSPTGYASDFFFAGDEAELSNEEILEAFQVRASRLFRENAKGPQVEQLPLGF